MTKGKVVMVLNSKTVVGIQKLVHLTKNERTVPWLGQN